MSNLLSFGHGYSAQALARLLLPQGWAITGTSRSEGKLAMFDAQGLRGLRFPATTCCLPWTMRRIC